jgi:hypothetical protein
MRNEVVHKKSNYIDKRTLIEFFSAEPSEEDYFTEVYSAKTNLILKLRIQMSDRFAEVELLDLNEQSIAQFAFLHFEWMEADLRNSDEPTLTIAPPSTYEDIVRGGAIFMYPVQLRIRPVINLKVLRS